MKHPITVEIDENFVAYEDGENLPVRPLFCVTEQRLTPYYDDNNYRCFSRTEPEICRAETIDALYEVMAQVRVNHMLNGEQQCRYGSRFSVENFTVEFSSTFIEVEPYDEARLKATTTYQNLGAARDLQREKEKAQAAQDRARALAWEAKQREEHDRAEFVRLSQKFKKG